MAHKQSNVFQRQLLAEKMLNECNHEKGMKVTFTNNFHLYMIPMARVLMRICIRFFSQFELIQILEEINQKLIGYYMYNQSQY